MTQHVVRVRIAVISDTHFGDPLCTLVSSNSRDPSPVVGPAYAPLARAIGSVDYLVLLGDILDFSVASYDHARQARCFFRRLRNDGLAREIVYIREITTSTSGTPSSTK